MWDDEYRFKDADDFDIYGEPKRPYLKYLVILLALGLIIGGTLALLSK